MIDRLLVMLLVACAAFAGLIAVEFVSDGTDRAAFAPSPVQAETTPKPRTQEPGVGDLVASSLAAPLFSPTRRPPESSGPAADPELSGVRLTGIVIQPDRRVAIFAASGAKPFVRSEGETLNEWQLDSISPLAVTLSGPAGTRILVPRPDPNLVRPASPVPMAAARKPAPPPGVAAGSAPGGTPARSTAAAEARRPPPRPPVANPAGRPPASSPPPNPTRQQ
jgi:hypothetical protein